MQLKRTILAIGLATAMLSAAPVSSIRADEPKLHAAVVHYIEERKTEFDQIPIERKEKLERLSEYLRNCKSTDKPARFVFVCTHNSRRSHISQLWAAVAAVHYGLTNVETFSGGTESTAFNPRAVAAMERAGLRIEISTPGDNPRYSVSFAQNIDPIVCFSKVYSDNVNPRENFCAVMTCSSADEACPTVKGAVQRVAIPYDDPKVADGTKEERSKYDERTAQICREMLYAFSHASKEPVR